MSAAIRADGLRFAFPAGSPARSVLRGVDLALDRGELVALVGPNGSGKTTLLRLLTGLLRPDAGRISIFGRPLERWSRAELARRVAVLPQSLELPPGFRVAELVEMARAPHARRLFGATPEDRDAVERALLEADATALADRRAGALSGGERQRVLVAMSLAQEPDLLLLDEPTIHLDLAHAVGVLRAVEALRSRRGVAVLAVVHDLALASTFAARVAVLHEGRIVADGPPQRVLLPSLIGRVFGVSVEEATTRDGRRVLVPLVAGGALPRPVAVGDE
ncbi:MAG TPA: ABC transporter ATP-binding protein [Candidatus Limnocylindria bacterium]|nr:ABC transporter ATP-binding protein [Candidatus Limnocylindria bacterium]